MTDTPREFPFDRTSDRPIQQHGVKRAETLPSSPQRPAPVTPEPPAPVPAEDWRKACAGVFEELSFWMTVADGVSHDPRCRNHLHATPQAEGWLCLRCQVERASETYTLRADHGGTRPAVISAENIAWARDRASLKDDLRLEVIDWRYILDSHEALRAALAAAHEALEAIHVSTRDDEKGEQWTIRAYLDAHGVFHDDIGGSRRLVAEACKVALAASPRRLRSDP